MSHAVFLRRVSDYDDPRLDAVVAAMLDAAGCPARPGLRVLVKPNLVAPRNPGLSCSEPRIVRAVCRHLLAAGAVVTVADSPAFGTGSIMARVTGLTAMLTGLPVRIGSLDRPTALRLSCGSCIGVSRVALEAEHIVNVARLKCHDQMGLTLAVKNFFGCVCGFRKSLAHQRFGRDRARFARMLLDVLAALPPSTSLLDGMVAMHKAGPVGGEPFALGLLAASANPVALDTAIYTLLGLTPEQIPLWKEATTLELPGTTAWECVYPMDAPQAFDTHGFEMPTTLSPLAFATDRFLRGRLRSLLVTLRRGR